MTRGIAILYRCISTLLVRLGHADRSVLRPAAKYLRPAATHVWGTIILSTTTALAQSLTLSVDPYSGVVTIQNQSMTTALSLDSYQITSASNQLLPDPTHTAGVGWDSLANTGLSGWEEVAPSAGALSELNLASTTSIAASGSLSLGHAFTPNGAPDLHWGYSAPANTLVLPAPLIYAGGLQGQVVSQLSNHGSTVEATNVVLLNQETSQSFNIDGYTIGSTSGSLNPAGFDGFAGHGVAGWEVVSPTANALSELNLSSFATLAPGHDQVLGSAFTSGATHDLAIQFHLVGGGGTKPNGTVLYRTELAGDANGDGVVNGLDIALIASNWLHAGSLPGDTNYDGVVNGLDISSVASHWLNVLAAGGGAGSAAAVPEPASVSLMVIGVVLWQCHARRQRSRIRLNNANRHHQSVSSVLA